MYVLQCKREEAQSTTCYQAVGSCPTVCPLTRHDATNIDCQKISKEAPFSFVVLYHSLITLTLCCAVLVFLYCSQFQLFLAQFCRDSKDRKIHHKSKRQKQSYINLHFDGLKSGIGLSKLCIGKNIIKHLLKLERQQGSKCWKVTMKNSVQSHSL